eukprot:11242111-Alexandrium_andersonii.AAC.1
METPPGQDAPASAARGWASGGARLGAPPGVFPGGSSLSVRSLRPSGRRQLRGVARARARPGGRPGPQTHGGAR